MHSDPTIGLHLLPAFRTPKTSKAPRRTPIRATITQADIDEMADAYESGMCDFARANAVCRSLRRRLNQPELRVERTTEGLCAKDGNKSVELGSELQAWLGEFERGIPVSPRSFVVHVPESWAQRF